MTDHLPPPPDPFLDALPGRRLWIRYGGRWRRAHLDAVARSGRGKTATVWISTADGRELHRRVSPHQHGVALTGAWKAAAARSFGFPSFEALLEAAAGGGGPVLGDRLWRPRPFLIGALANAVDLALMRAGASPDELPDRGDLPRPETVPWRSEPWRPTWEEGDDP